MSTDLDAHIIADQERAIARLRAEVELLEQRERDLEEIVVERFNPPDDDSFTAYAVIEQAAAFVEGLPCECKATAPVRLYVEARDLQAQDVEHQHHYGVIEGDERDWADLPIERVEDVGDTILVWYGVEKLWGTTLKRPFRFAPDRRVWVQRGPVVFEVDEPCARCRVLGRVSDGPVAR